MITLKKEVLFALMTGTLVPGTFARIVEASPAPRPKIIAASWNDKDGNLRVSRNDELRLTYNVPIYFREATVRAADELYLPVYGDSLGEGAIMTKIGEKVAKVKLGVNPKLLITGAYRTGPTEPGSDKLMRDSPSGINTRVHNSGKIRNIAGLTTIATEHSVNIGDPRYLARFRTTGALRTPRTGHEAVALDDGRVLVVGGHDRRSSSQNPPLASESELYDPLTSSWWNVSGFSVGSRIPGRVLHTATKLRDGRVLIVGGYAQDTGMSAAGPSNRAFLFYPASNRFSILTSRLSAGRQEHSATLLADGRVLIVAGRSWYATATTGYYYTPPVEIFDPKTSAFSVAEQVSNAWFASQLWSRRSAVGLGNSVLLTSTDQASTVSWPVLMTESGAQYTNGHLNTARSRAQAGYVAQRDAAFVVGGFTASGALITTLETLNPSTKTWTTLPRGLSVARHSFGVAVLGNDAFLIGGRKADSVDTTRVDVFDARYADPAVLNYFPESQRVARAWPATYALTTIRSGFTATTMTDGRILVAGGTVVSGTCEVFTRP